MQKAERWLAFRFKNENITILWATFPYFLKKRGSWNPYRWVNGVF